MSDTEAAIPDDALEQAMAKVEPLPPEQPKIRPVVETQQTKQEREAFLRAARVPFINAYLDMRMTATGVHRMDEACILEMDTIRHMTERAYANRATVERVSL